MEGNEETTRSKILLVINDFLTGGAQRLLVDLMQQWDPNLYELHLLTFREYPGRGNLIDSIPPYVRRHHLQARNIFDIKAQMSTRKLIKQLKPAIIISNLYFANTLSRVSLLGDETPVVTVEHNTYRNKNIFQHCVDWILSFKSFKVVAVSEAVREFLISYQRISPSKIEVIANGIALERIERRRARDSRAEIRKSLGIPENEIVILLVGRLVAQKDPLLALRAFARFVEISAGIRSRIVIVGSGELDDQIRTESERLGISELVFLIGEADPHRFYMSADIFLSTSIIEGFGLVRAEALAYGLPVVTTGTGGTDELIRNGQNGIVVLNRDPNKIGEGIQQALAIDKAIVSKNAAMAVNNFSIESTARNYERLIKQAIESRQSPHETNLQL